MSENRFKIEKTIYLMVQSSNSGKSGWQMDEKEAEELKKELKDAWKKWEL